MTMDFYVNRLAVLSAAFLFASCYQSYPRIAVDEDAVDIPCTPRVTEARRITPGVFVLLDRSRSMDYPDYGLLYWEPACEAIEGVVEELQEDVAFGLGYFPDEACDAYEPNCCGMSEAAVPVRLANLGPIRASLDATYVDGGTPTAPSVTASLGSLTSYIDLGAAFIMLVTDGVPNCNDSLSHPGCVCTNPSGVCDNATQCLDDTRTYDALRAARDAGVLVYVVGLVGGSGTSWTEVMHAMADAGGTGEATLVSDPEDILPVMSELARHVTPCLFDVDRDFFEDDPDSVTFEVGGVTWSRDPARLAGWDLVAPDRIRFFGAPCDDILGSGIAWLDGTAPCI